MRSDLASRHTVSQTKQFHVLEIERTNGLELRESKKREEEANERAAVRMRWQRKGREGKREREETWFRITIRQTKQFHVLEIERRKSRKRKRKRKRMQEERRKPRQLNRRIAKEGYPERRLNVALESTAHGVKTKAGEVL